LRRHRVRRGMPVAALCLATTCATGVPAAAQELDTQGTPTAEGETARAARVGVTQRRLHVRAGKTLRVAGSVRPAGPGHTVALQIRRGSRWVTLDRDRTDGRGRYVLRKRMRGATSARARVTVVNGPARVRRSVGRLNVYRTAAASWYGPGLYGNKLGCGGTLSAGELGVAHKSLPCGTRITFRHHGRSVRVRVIDRGPYVGGREYDLTAAAASRIGFRGHGAILATR